MAIFGVPTVHEDDALRACRAAVEIRSRLAELEPQIQAERGVTHRVAERGSTPVRSSPGT